MAYTETRTVGYGSRVKNSFGNILTGLVVFIAGTVLLWWNEGRAVHRADDIAEVGKTAIHIDDISRIDPSNEGRLIHANGTIETQDVLSDATFGVKANAISLARDVEYYQWYETSHTETKEKIGGSQEEITTYEYEQRWVSQPVNSSEFKDPEAKTGKVNKVINKFSEMRDKYAYQVKFGAYRLPATFIHRIGGRRALTVNPDSATLSELNAQIVKLVNPSANAAEQNYVHVQGNQIYLGRNASSPEVGDVRITYYAVQPTVEASIIGVSSADTLSTYRTENGSQDCYVSTGTHTLEEMMKSAEEANTFLTWVLRIIGIFVVIGGLKMAFSILGMLLAFLPFLKSIMNFAVGLVCSVVGFAWSLVIIALAWLFYRPVLAIILLAVAGGLIYFFAQRGKQQKTN